MNRFPTKITGSFASFVISVALSQALVVTVCWPIRYSVYLFIYFIIIIIIIIIIFML